jgi:hypothetical protein
MVAAGPLGVLVSCNSHLRLESGDPEVTAIDPPLGHNGDTVNMGMCSYVSLFDNKGGTTPTTTDIRREAVEEAISTTIENDRYYQESLGVYADLFLTDNFPNPVRYSGLQPDGSDRNLHPEDHPRVGAHALGRPRGIEGDGDLDLAHTGQAPDAGLGFAAQDLGHAAGRGGHGHQHLHPVPARGQRRGAHGIDQAQLDDVDGYLRVVALVQLPPHLPLEVRARRGRRGRGGGHGFGFSVLTTAPASPRMAAFRVCQARLAHLTRTGKALTPEKAASLPSASRSKQGSRPPVTI